MQYKTQKYQDAKLFLFISFFFFVKSYFGQQEMKFIWPIDSPFILTGNYGELRPNHFHAGIDFSTSGKINLPIYCVEEGYISRIRVSPYGYGKCVYITHPNGKVSVYAHLNAFSLKVEKLAKENQYVTQNYEIDFMPRPRMAYVRKNEIIGLSGNTGGSTGPHLHFEIRDELSEVPLNPLLFYKINDRSAPEINSLAFYNLADTTSPKLISTRKIRQGRSDSLIMDDDHFLLNHSNIGVAYSGLDRCYSNGNANTIFSVQVYFDETLIYEHQLNKISFEESRFINEFSDKIGSSKFQKCFLPTVYPLGMIGSCINKGRIILSDSAYSKVKIVFTDESGNKSPLEFYLKAKKIEEYFSPEEKSNLYVNCSEPFVSLINDLYLFIPEKTLFYSKNISINNTINDNGKLSIFPDLNLKQAVTLGFKVPDKYFGLAEKLILEGATSAYPISRNDSVFYQIKNFGKFQLNTDTLPPKIRVNHSESALKDAWNMDDFSFKISDNGSGIGKYNLWLNNSWVMAEYDAKQDLLTYSFDEDTPIGILNFKLEVFDKVGNKAFLEFVLKK